MISAIPKPAKIAGLAYMETTEIAPERRKIENFMITLDERYGETDSEKSWAWLNALTEFARLPGGVWKIFGQSFPDAQAV